MYQSRNFGRFGSLPFAGAWFPSNGQQDNHQLAVIYSSYPGHYQLNVQGVSDNISIALHDNPRSVISKDFDSSGYLDTAIVGPRGKRLAWQIKLDPAISRSNLKRVLFGSYNAIPLALKQRSKFYKLAALHHYRNRSSFITSRQIFSKLVRKINLRGNYSGRPKVINANDEKESLIFYNATSGETKLISLEGKLLKETIFTESGEPVFFTDINGNNSIGLINQTSFYSSDASKFDFPVLVDKISGNEADNPQTLPTPFSFTPTTNITLAPTSTPLQPMPTPTLAPTSTATTALPTLTPSATFTNTSTYTATNTPTITNTPTSTFTNTQTQTPTSTPTLSAPTISSVLPDSALGTNPTRTITVNGSGFLNGARVYVNSTECDSVSFVSATELNCSINLSLAFGSHNLTVVNPDLAIAIASNAFTTIGSPILYLRADSITGLSNGAEVTSWNDQSLNNNHAIQNSSVRKPNLVLNAIGGKPGLEFSFDGGDYDHLAISDNATLKPANLTLMIVFKDNGSLTFGKLISRDINNSGTWGPPYISFGLEENNNSNGIRFIRGLSSGVQYLDGSPEGTNGIGYLITASYSGTSGEFVLRRNGTSLGNFTGNAGSPDYTINANSPWVIGSRSVTDPGDYFVGTIAEIVVYGSVLSLSERNTVESFLNSKYTLY